jgi:hypothetical protein
VATNGENVMPNFVKSMKSLQKHKELRLSHKPTFPLRRKSRLKWPCYLVQRHCATEGMACTALWPINATLVFNSLYCYYSCRIFQRKSSPLQCWVLWDGLLILWRYKERVDYVQKKTVYLYSAGTMLEYRQECRLFWHVYLDRHSIYAVIKQIYRNCCKSLDTNRLAYIAQDTWHFVKFRGDATHSYTAKHQHYNTSTKQECYEYKPSFCTHKY